jgi:Tfp pilus assembly protein PilX
MAREEGFVLVLALTILVVLTITGMTMYGYSNAGQHESWLSEERTRAADLAEAGLNSAFAVLNLPSNNALRQTTLPVCADSGAGCLRADAGSVGYALYGGTLDTSTNTWTITSIGHVRRYDNAADVTRKMTATVAIKVSLTQPLNNPAWNYVYATHPPTPGVCDETLQQSVTINSPFFVSGNLCLQNTAQILSGPLDVKGSVTLTQKQNAIGSSAKPLNEAHIVGGCKWQNNSWHATCSSADNVFATLLDSTPTNITPPTVYWDD